MKVVILCGGQGTRLREETEYRPKPMVEIGGIPLLLHIMKMYSDQGHNEFILCLGYKGEQIRDFFLNKHNNLTDVEIKIGKEKTEVKSFKNYMENWKITLANTGLNAQTGARIKKIQKYIDDEDFLVTYGDGVSDVDINKIIELHKKEGNFVTLTGVHPRSKYGTMELKGNKIVKFMEKPVLKEYVNGGFYVFNKKAFDYLVKDDDCVLETYAFTKLAEVQKIGMYNHDGFWFAVDTYKEYLDLNKLWDTGKKPWWKE
jgi:glucose-1-phosphate cytidylyltransferase